MNDKNSMIQDCHFKNDEGNGFFQNCKLYSKMKNGNFLAYIKRAKEIIISFFNF